MNELNAVGLVLELLSVIGITLAVLLVFCVLTTRLVDNSWVSTEAVVVDDPHGPLARWLTAENTIHSRQLDPDEVARYGELEVITVYYSRRSPDRMRCSRMSTAQRVLWVLFAVAAIIGVGSTVTSIVLAVLDQ